MIFFMTVIIPPSQITEKLRVLQNTLFKNKLILPTAFPLICHSLSDRKMTRLSRSQIADLYPPALVTTGYSMINSDLYLKITSTDDKQFDTKEMGILLGKIINPERSLEEYQAFDDLQFKNFSLALYEISSITKDNFWMNMSWTKLWEVPRKK